MANTRKIRSPVTIPATIKRVFLKPEARERLTTAKTPGPGETASNSIAVENPKKAVSVIKFSLIRIWHVSVLETEWFSHFQAG